MAMYLDIAGVPGHASHGKYGKWVVIHSMTWGLAVDVETTVGASGNRLSAGKITNGDMHFHKEFDTATVPLMQLGFSGVNTKEARFVVTTEAGDNGETYLEYTLKNVIISSYQTTAHSHGKPSDNFTLNFTEVEIKTSPSDEMGKPMTAVTGYDFATAVAS